YKILEQSIIFTKPRVTEVYVDDLLLKVNKRQDHPTAYTDHQFFPKQLYPLRRIDETGIYNITITLAGTSTSGVRLYKKLSDSDNLVPISEPFYVGTTTLTELSLEENAYIGLQTYYDYGDLGYFDLTGCSLVINSLTSTEPFI